MQTQILGNSSQPRLHIRKRTVTAPGERCKEGYQERCTGYLCWSSGICMGRCCPGHLLQVLFPSRYRACKSSSQAPGVSLCERTLGQMSNGSSESSLVGNITLCYINSCAGRGLLGISYYIKPVYNFSCPPQKSWARIYYFPPLFKLTYFGERNRVENDRFKLCQNLKLIVNQCLN